VPYQRALPELCAQGNDYQQEDDEYRSGIVRARTCVGRGGEWVLRSGDEIYRLKSQVGIEEFAGQNVKVGGTLDAKTNTIDNASIEMAPMAKRPASPR